MKSVGILTLGLVALGGCGRLRFDPLGDGSTGDGPTGDGVVRDGPGVDGQGSALCGDGVAQAGEQCDDGGASLACSAACTLIDQGPGGTCATPKVLVLARTPTGHGALATGNTSLASNGAQVTCTPANTLDESYQIGVASAETLTVTITPMTAWNPVAALRDSTLACNQATTYCCTNLAGTGQAETSACAVPAGMVNVVVDASAGNQSGPYTLAVSAP